MKKVQLFSSGMELANLVVTSDLLELSRDAILDLYKDINQNQPPSSPASVKFKVSQEANCTIIAVVTKDHLQGGEGELISSSTNPDFEFLCTTSNPSVTINKAALDLFHSIQTELSNLPEIKDPINANSSQKKNDYDKSKTLLITGHSLGGSVASLFTLWLLDKFKYSNTKRPLCLTFGSPFIGDGGLREAILKYSTWNTCFLHMVSDQDPVPRVLISPQDPPIATEYKPFGTFLLCSDKLGCACFEDSESILKLLKETKSEGAENQNPNQGSQFGVYEKTIKHLNGKVIYTDTTKLVEKITLPLHAGIYTQLVAIGRLQTQQEWRIIENLIKWIERQERKLVMGKRQGFDLASKKLNDMKIYMVYMEWYKKYSKKKNIGYYDSYKNMATKTDQAVEGFKKKLTIYWKNVVNESKSKPQKEGAALRTRWLYGGTTYRRMIEPLDIAEYYYYYKGEKEYQTQGRSEHYKLLEEAEQQEEENGLLEEKKPARSSLNVRKKNVESILTEDSCFWAHVEEALISCKLLNSGDSSQQKKLKEFEDYAFPLIEDYAVSPEIFLPQSNFMELWKEYKQIIRKEMMGTSYTSSFTEWMNNTLNYEQYESGKL